MTTALYVVAILVVLAYVLVAGLCKAASKPTPPPPGSLQARADELRARESVRTQNTVKAEPDETTREWVTGLLGRTPEAESIVRHIEWLDGEAARQAANIRGAVEEIVWLRAVLKRVELGNAVPTRLARDAIRESETRLPLGGQ